VAGRARLVAAALLALVGAVACAPAPAVISDPREILDRAVQHLAVARTVHLEATVEGRISFGGLLGLPGLGGASGQLGLAGTHAEGDLDLARRRAGLRFQVPALLGLTGEIRQVGSDAYLQSSLTARGWHRLNDGDLPPAIGQPAEWLAGLREWLAHPATVPTRQADAACPSGTCYVVRVSAGPEDLAVLASAAPELAAGLADARASVELRIDRASFVVTSAAFNLDLGSGGSLTVSSTFTRWDAGVTIEAPPDSEIVSGPLLP
jgi:hypothetical protein